MINNTKNEDYIDQISRLLPYHRSFTTLERILIIVIVSSFVSFVGCILFCLLYPRSFLRRKYFVKKKTNKEQHYLINTISGKNLLIIPPPPCYESIGKTEEILNLDKLAKSPYLNIGRKYSNGTVSDSEGILYKTGSDQLLSLDTKNVRSQSVRSSFSHNGTLSTISNTYPLPPYAQLEVELDFDIVKNFLNIHLINGEHFPIHPAFDEQAEYVIRVQLSNNKLFNKIQESWKKRRSSLSFNAWKKQQEKVTKSLPRTSNDTLICDEFVQLQFEKNDLALTSLRFLLFCIDRSGIQDLMFESIIPMNPSLVPKHKKIIEFQNPPQITFGEIFLGISYLPTSQRFTIHINKIRYFCKTEKEKKIDLRLTMTFLHQGRRFFQKKIPFIFNSSTIDNEIKDIITQNIPQNKIQSVYIHIELNSKTNSFLSSTSILLGEHTRYQSDWQKMLEHPRQTHLGWYQFLG
ncbi:hypothetical protein I4U23_025920 [Adineta vaga]|nr:hypothetical protein I4U23_025920 [Adineta vaga]